jgi:hypothetical protein
MAQGRTYRNQEQDEIKHRDDHGKQTRLHDYFGPVSLLFEAVEEALTPIDTVDHEI